MGKHERENKKTEEMHISNENVGKKTNEMKEIQK